MTEQELAELASLAKKATPGPWDVWKETTQSKTEAIAELAYQVDATPDDNFAGAVYLLNANGKCPATTGCGPTSEANAAFIAAANPEKILALISLLQAQQEEIGRLREAVKTILPYLRWTISDESPGHHPTMPSAVAVVEAAIRTPILERGEAGK